MISKINNKKKDIAEKIYLLFQASYKIEAELLKATDFPPLKRTASNLLDCNNIFFGFHINEDIVGLIEVDHHSTSTHIQSLVVNPRNFRQGIGKQLVNFILEYYKSNSFTVETGLENYPAIKLYKEFDFKEIKQWDTDHGVKKIKFEKIIN